MTAQADGLLRTNDGKLHVTLGSGSVIDSPSFTGTVTLPGSGSMTATEWVVPSDLRITRQSGVLGMIVGSDGVWYAASELTQRSATANGQGITMKALTELTTIAAAATTDTTIQMPANAIVVAVSVRVTVLIPTAATFTVGDSGSAARFSTAAVAVAAGTTDVGTKAGAYYNASALSVRITPNLTPASNTGRVRVTIHYYLVTPPTT